VVVVVVNSESPRGGRRKNGDLLEVRGRKSCLLLDHAAPLFFLARLRFAHPLFLPAVGREVVHGDLHALAQLEFAQRVIQQVEVEGVGVVKVVVVTGGLDLLFWGQDLR